MIFSKTWQRYLFFICELELAAANLLLAQISLRKGAMEHVLHCEGSIRGLAVSTVWAKCSGASYQHCNSYDAIHARTLCRTLWYGEKLGDIARQLHAGFLLNIFLKQSLKLERGRRVVRASEEDKATVVIKHLNEYSHSWNIGTRNSWESRTVAREADLSSSLCRSAGFLLPSFSRSTKCYSWIDFLFLRFVCKDFYNQRRVGLSIKSASRRDCEKHGAKDSSLY